MFSTMNLIVGIVTGAFGLAYFVYGKKQGKLLFMISGIALMGYPYLVGNGVALILVGLVLLGLPFLFRE